MKKLAIIAATLVLTLAFCFSASAAPKTFANGVTVDVPDGWTAEEIPSSVILASTTEEAAVSITRDDSEGQSLKDMVKEFATQFKSNQPKLIDGEYVFEFKQDGLDCVGFLSMDGNIFTFTALIGHSADFDVIKASIR